MEYRAVSVSHHGMCRNKKRFNIHGDRRSEFQLKADMRTALCADDFEGRERAWILRHERDNSCVYISGEKCIILSSDDRIITTYVLPRWFNYGRPMYAGKQRIRDLRSYLRLNRSYGLILSAEALIQ